ncbi:MAG TPA: Gfo/Idh/MocA family oxidoreductase [Candidatus Lokiarchaeia archaeon]|nr:Gfo/Idh/MocA family oxidoreductase [Candidatus Lokiarchaeia archaeon]
MASKGFSGPVTAVLVGAGTRGRDAYGRYAEMHPDRLKFIAVAEPDVDKRHRFQEIHAIPDSMAFETWQELFESSKGKLAEVAFICTPDRLHYEPALQALQLDYHLVLEKPIAPTVEECQGIARLAAEKQRLVQVCHVLRFTEFWKKIKEIIDSGRIGKIVHYDHSENVEYWHFGHSYVRGPYKNKATSTPIVLAKTCHDLDLMFWILGEKAIDVESSGTIAHFRPENAPAGAPNRCTDGCPVEKECPWFAPRLYLTAEPLVRTGLHAPSRIIRNFTKWILKSKAFIKFIALFDKRAKKLLNWDEFPVTAITNDFSVEGKMKALREGPFGVCVYHAGNDVPDHMVSTFTFLSGATGTITMHGFSEQDGRELRIFGTKGVLRGIFRQNRELIEVTDFRFENTQVVHEAGLTVNVHGGGDIGIMDAFTAVLLGEVPNDKGGITDVQSAMESHYMGFAAEDAREQRAVLDIDSYRQAR